MEMQQCKAQRNFSMLFTLYIFTIYLRTKIISVEESLVMLFLFDDLVMLQLRWSKAINRARFIGRGNTFYQPADMTGKIKIILGT